MVTNFLNFVMVAGSTGRVGEGLLREQLALGLPDRPAVEFAMALLTAGIAFGYERLGVGAVGLAAVVLFVCQYLLRAGIQAYERGEELEQPHARARIAPGRASSARSCRRCRCATR